MKAIPKYSIIILFSVLFLTLWSIASVLLSIFFAPYVSQFYGFMYGVGLITLYKLIIKIKLEYLD